MVEDMHAKEKSTVFQNSLHKNPFLACSPIGEWKHDYDCEFEFVRYVNILHNVTLHCEIFFAMEINLLLDLGIKSNQLNFYKT